METNGIKRVGLGVAVLAAVTIACACTAPDDASTPDSDAVHGQEGTTATAGSEAGTVPATAATDDVQGVASTAVAPVDVAAPPSAPAVADAEASANTAGDAAIDQQIAELVGDVASFRALFGSLQRAVKADDRETVAGLVDYPFTLRQGGKPKRVIRNQDAFIAHWDDIMKDDVRKAVQDQTYAGLFVNQNGAMLGNGQVWIAGICQDNACSKSVVRISAINPGAP